MQDKDQNLFNTNYRISLSIVRKITGRLDLDQRAQPSEERWCECQGDDPE